MNNILTDDFKYETIVLGAGCFWCAEAVFKMLKGIISVDTGYAGGHKENPIYEDVSAGTTGHAEVVQIKYNPRIISLDDIFTVFFATHNPTTLNKQGADEGEQYRSIILYTDEDQKEKAKNFIRKLNLSSKRGKPVVTEVRQLDAFYEAEIHHKDYYKKHPEQKYCQVVINPKLNKVKKKFAKLLKTK
ncbi:MAG: peptide-methionine (S)-S-oxide reductase MsrA [Candidatus Staskawiczbacteria bacterium]|nr:peptide-methionine (S)-S-oxide reductase MsrA [Candidatus Staskawiczbacteria bacterium]